MVHYYLASIDDVFNGITCKFTCATVCFFWIISSFGHVNLYVIIIIIIGLVDKTCIKIDLLQGVVLFLIFGGQLSSLLHPHSTRPSTVYVDPGGPLLKSLLYIYTSLE
jgi:hypothetical protein